MATLSLWVNIIAFAFMVSGVGLTAVIYSRKRQRWLIYYLAYAAGYALWTLLFSLAFFTTIYESVPRGWVFAVTPWVRLVVSAAILFSISMLAAELVRGQRRRRILRVIAVILAITFALLSLGSFSPVTYRYAAGINVAYNLTAGVLAVLVWRSLRTTPIPSAKRLLPPFLAVSTVFYGAAALAGVVIALLDREVQLLSSFAIAAYCLPWSVVMIHGQTRYLARGESGAPVPEAFASDYRLTPREREIVAALARGLSNTEIAESHYVSLKTVETHLYNVYRKVGVKNRVGLVNALALYRGEGNGPRR
ncbi:MAG: hypothetical protein GVY29_13230 [Spirochaetes bacterium]|jgi:DNA-binding CsgD family transcriptional regulator|nr:hypothetical protein [Spirochaetota bacterium]